MQTYRYRPTRFYALCFALTWGNWLLALLFGEGPLLLVFMVLGLFSPAAVATATEPDALQTAMSREGFAIISGDEDYALRFRALELWGELSARWDRLRGA